MRRPVALLLSLALAAGALAGCGTADATSPPDINYGRDLCVECGMSIDDPRFAAGYRLADGTEKIFDDLGGLILHHRKAGDDLSTASVWVHDFETEEWAEATTAHYVPTLSVASPMGHSILAFSDRDRAEQAAADLDGEVISWTVVLELPETEGRLGHHHTGEMTGNDAEMGHDHEDTDNG